MRACQHWAWSWRAPRSSWRHSSPPPPPSSPAQVRGTNPDFSSLLSLKILPGFPGYCSESFPGQSCNVVCDFGRNNVPLCQVRQWSSPSYDVCCLLSVVQHGLSDHWGWSSEATALDCWYYYPPHPHPSVCTSGMDSKLARRCSPPLRISIFVRGPVGWS